MSTTAEQLQLAQLSKSLDDADDQMLDWMHAFKEDFKDDRGMTLLLISMIRKQKL